MNWKDLDINTVVITLIVSFVFLVSFSQMVGCQEDRHKHEYIYFEARK